MPVTVSPPFRAVSRASRMPSCALNSFDASVSSLPAAVSAADETSSAALPSFVASLWNPSPASSRHADPTAERASYAASPNVVAPLFAVVRSHCAAVSIWPCLPSILVSRLAPPAP